MLPAFLDIPYGAGFDAVLTTACLLQILGNKSLKMKYLNPSTVFIATGPSEGLLTEDLDPSSVALTVQIVDTVTGAPVHRQIHKVVHCFWDWNACQLTHVHVFSKVKPDVYATSKC